MQYRYRGDEVDSRANTVGRAKQQLWQQVGPALSLGPGATLKHRNLSIIDRSLSAPVSNIADASSESQIWRATPALNRLIVFGHRLLGCTAGNGLTQTDRQTYRRLFVLKRLGAAAFYSISNELSQLFRRLAVAAAARWGVWLMLIFALLQLPQFSANLCKFTQKVWNPVFQLDF